MNSLLAASHAQQGVEQNKLRTTRLAPPVFCVITPTGRKMKMTTESVFLHLLMFLEHAYCLWQNVLAMAELEGGHKFRATKACPW